MRILTDRQEELLKDERRVLHDLQMALTKFGISEEDNLTLTRSIHQLDELFLLVVVGEFNSGKSSFINALLGKKLLKEGVTPTTTQINILRYGEGEQRTLLEENLLLISAPVDLLREISIVDTPGTNAVMREHEAITSQFIPRSDLVLFVTSADRPFTESERSFLANIRDWGKKLVIILNKTDLFSNIEELKQVTDFIVENCRSLLGITPEVFPLSSRLALNAKLGQPELWQGSGFEALENHIHDTLDEKGRLMLKFLSPLGVGLHLNNQYQSTIAGRLQLLTKDNQMLDNVERQLELYREDMTSDFNYRMSDIENILYEMEQRGQQFFDETMRLTRVPDLMNRTKIQHQFEKQVIADVPEQIDRKVNEMIDWLVDRDLRQWEAVNQHLQERRREYKEHILGDGIGTFQYDRERLFDAVGKEASRVVDTYDKTREARLIASGAQDAVAAAAVLEVGAIGIGAIVTTIATTMAVDVTGILVASLVAILGFFIIPAKRRQANKEMSAKVNAMRIKLADSLRTEFEREIKRSLENIHTAMQPYTRFVRAENNKLLEAQDTLTDIRLRTINLQEHARIEWGSETPA